MVWRGDTVASLEPFALGAFNDDYDTSLHSNRGRFLYTDITLRF